MGVPMGRYIGTKSPVALTPVIFKGIPPSDSARLSADPSRDPLQPRSAGICHLAIALHLLWKHHESCPRQSHALSFLAKRKIHGRRSGSPT